LNFTASSSPLQKQNRPRIAFLLPLKNAFTLPFALWPGLIPPLCGRAPSGVPQLLVSCSRSCSASGPPLGPPHVLLLIYLRILKTLFWLRPGKIPIPPGEHLANY